MAREDDERREMRREQHLRRLGERRPRCARCGTEAPAALAVRDGQIVCAECRADEDGRSPIEDHHLAGRSNDATTHPLPANVHRQVSDEQRDWPNDTLRNPHESPLRRLAAWQRGERDLQRVLAQHTCAHPRFLERLDERLTDLYGEQWPDALGLDSPER